VKEMAFEVIKIIYDIAPTVQWLFKMLSFLNAPSISGERI